VCICLGLPECQRATSYGHKVGCLIERPDRPPLAVEALETGRRCLQRRWPGRRSLRRRHLSAVAAPAKEDQKSASSRAPKARSQCQRSATPYDKPRYNPALKARFMPSSINHHLLTLNPAVRQLPEIRPPPDYHLSTINHSPVASRSDDSRAASRAARRQRPTHALSQMDISWSIRTFRGKFEAIGLWSRTWAGRSGSVR
jgi:hypothetical protein